MKTKEEILKEKGFDLEKIAYLDEIREVMDLYADERNKSLLEEVQKLKEKVVSFERSMAIYENYLKNQ